MNTGSVNSTLFMSGKEYVTRRIERGDFGRFISAIYLLICMILFLKPQDIRGIAAFYLRIIFYKVYKLK